MNLTDAQKQSIFSVVVGAVMAILGVILGVNVAPKAELQGGIGVESVGPNVTSLRGLQVQNAATINGAATVNGVATFNSTTTVNGNETVTGTLTLAGQAFTGATRYGVTTTVATGSIIPHGMSITPTVIMLSAGSIYTPAVSAINAVSFTVQTSTTVPTLYWFAGK